MEWLCSLSLNRNKAIPPQFHRTLNELIEALIKPETLKRDLFFALLLIVIKENDFVQSGNIEIDVVDYIVAKRKDRRHVYEIHVILYPYEDSPANIIVSSINETMLINAVVDATKETHSLCLAINEHLATSCLGIPSSFYRLEELINSLKEKIVVPVRNSILSYHNQPCSNLFGLPDDALYQILLSLSVRDILNIAKSSKKLNKLLKKDDLWYLLYKRDFPKTGIDNDADWRNVYKKEYVRRTKQRAKKTTVNVRDVIDESGEWLDMPVRDSRWEIIL